jgi:hypothetical protein
MSITLVLSAREGLCPKKVFFRPGATISTVREAVPRYASVLCP